MRVLFIRPAQRHWDLEAKKVGTPLGLLCLAGTLAKHHDVGFVDVAAEGYDCEQEILPHVFRFGLPACEIARRIKAFAPDIVAINASFTVFWRECLEIAEIVRSIDSRIRVIVGGQHASGVAAQILNCERDIDFVILHEGESSLVKLVESLGKGNKSLEDIDGIAYRDKGKVIITKPGAPNRKLWMPELNLLTRALYKPAMSHFCEPRGKSFIDLMFTRGCPTGCEFCTSSRFFGSSLRSYDENEIRLLVQEVKDMGWDEISVEDDNFARLPRKYARLICRALHESGLHWNIDGGLYYPLIDDELVDMLADNNCYRVFLPLESPFMNIMHSQGKYLSVEDNEHHNALVKRATELLRSRNIEFYTAVMIGFPGQHFDSIKASLGFGKRTVEYYGAMGLTANWVHPFPGTSLYEKYYNLVPQERKWENAPEYYTFIKPIFPVQDATLYDAEQYFQESLRKINLTDMLNSSCELGKFRGTDNCSSNCS